MPGDEYTSDMILVRPVRRDRADEDENGGGSGVKVCQ
jgi:hypothetical protein